MKNLNWFLSFFLLPLSSCCQCDLKTLGYEITEHNVTNNHESLEGGQEYTITFMLNGRKIDRYDVESIFNTIDLCKFDTIGLDSIKIQYMTFLNDSGCSLRSIFTFLYAPLNGIAPTSFGEQIQYHPNGNILRYSKVYNNKLVGVSYALDINGDTTYCAFFDEFGEEVVGYSGCGRVVEPTSFVTDSFVTGYQPLNERIEKVEVMDGAIVLERIFRNDVIFQDLSYLFGVLSNETNYLPNGEKYEEIDYKTSSGESVLIERKLYYEGELVESQRVNRRGKLKIKKYKSKNK
jgi:hypothetical protein